MDLPRTCRLRCIAVCISALLPLLSTGQQAFSTVTSGNYRESALFDILNDLEAKYAPIRICVEPDKLPWYKFNYSFTGKTLHETLTELLTAHGLMYITLNDSMVGVCKKTDLNAVYLRDLRTRCQENRIEQPEFLRANELDITLGQPGPGAAKPVVQVVVTDDISGTAIVGASVRVDGRPAGPATNVAGETRFVVDTGSHTLTLDYIGYRQTIVHLIAWQSGKVAMPMKSNPLLIQEVQISGNRAADKVQNTQTAVEALQVQTIKELPSLMGEADVVKSLTVLPGVTSAGEGASGFNVRGGNIDQNLTLQDNAPLFNTAHVLGLFSVYNPDLVQTVTLYKGHIPAHYGGRIASVLDVQLRDGDFTRYHGNVGIGIATGKAFLEGPILKNRLSFIGGYRRSYSDWLLRSTSLLEVRKSSAWFGDGLLKMTARFGNSSLSVSGYQTDDYLRYSNQFGYRWRNRLLNATFRSPLGDKIISVLQADLGQYEGRYFVPEGTDAFEISNGLRYQNANWRLLYTPNDRQEIQAGLQWERLNGLPETLKPIGDNSVVNAGSVPKSRGETYTLFVEEDWRISARWQVTAGIRASVFRQFDAGTVYSYAENAPVITENIIDSASAGRSETIGRYSGIEPRLSAKYQLNESGSLKISYNRVNQYVHLISNLSAPTPVDIWQVSTPYIRPQQSDNIDLGFATEWNDQNLEFTADLFFRETRNVPVYRNNPQLLNNPHLETELVAGRNRSRGLELAIKRKKGLLSGWVSYTYTRSTLSVAARYPEDVINRGQVFSSDYDQPHQLNILVKYAPRPSFYFVVNYVYRTGRPTTAPGAVYQVGTVIVPDYAYRNNLRIPDYHRLDISMNLDQNKSRISGVKTSFSLSVYNALFRKNPYTVFFQKRLGAPVGAYSLSLIGTAIPSANLTFTF